MHHGDHGSYWSNSSHQEESPRGRVACLLWSLQATCTLVPTTTPAPSLLQVGGSTGDDSGAAYPEERVVAGSSSGGWIWREFYPLVVPSWDWLTRCSFVCARFPTGYEEAYAFFDSFRTRVRNLEHQLKWTRIRTAQHRRVHDPCLIFRDLKAEKAASVEVLIQSTTGEVEEVDHDESAITLRTDTLFSGDVPLVLAGKRRQVIHATPDKLWLDDVSGAAPGSVVRQEKSTGDLPSLFRAFGAEWERWWHRRMDQIPGRWQRFQAEVLPLIPHAEMLFEPISLDQWRRAVQTKKRQSATGPDGVSPAGFAAVAGWPDTGAD